MPALFSYMIALLLLVSSLDISVYSTAGNILQHLSTPEGREKTHNILQRLHINHIYLEGRRGDEYVTPDLLRANRDFFKSRGYRVTGGIATVPGKWFGDRQDHPLGWLNWEGKKTRDGIAGFFRENAAIFDEIIVDDFFCTGDASPASDKARGSRAWADYRQDLLVNSIQPLMFEPARAVNPNVKIVIKYPQWYDRFHMFGYNPQRMSPPFQKVWVGTEVRNPATRRMGHVQPTEGYMNLRWISSVVGHDKVEGAWFDHIECTAQNFVDQAYESVLAGAKELTLFNLGDVVTGHPGHDPFVKAYPELSELAATVRPAKATGIYYYKPVASDAADNLYLMDYLGMIGLPVVPAASWPNDAKVVFLGAQAAADPRIAERLKGDTTFIATPAFLRKIGPAVQTLFGAKVDPTLRQSQTKDLVGFMPIPLPMPVDLDGAVALGGAKQIVSATVDGRNVPFLTQKGKFYVLNVRTFSEKDFRDVGEWLLAPRPLGLSSIPTELADLLRKQFLAPLGLTFNAPSGIALTTAGGKHYLYSFLDRDAGVRLNGRAMKVPANSLLRVP